MSHAAREIGPAYNCRRKYVDILDGEEKKEIITKFNCLLSKKAQDDFCVHPLHQDLFNDEGLEKVKIQGFVTSHVHTSYVTGTLALLKRRKGI